MVVMNTENLNLARKWRSRTFDQVVGQDLSVRILKNSLYLQQFFPVYLFSGQHGCGKTTTARIFAGAVNCSNLEMFQQDPKNHLIPCLQCASCLAMTEGNHPDFIEIDGASHTGVDNVRHIIDIAAFLPVLGRKKIYLIDEAHMLSKAAFNAFLKILEEPPATALFILATTELHKIIETVRSRSFQIFFRSVTADLLLNHLEVICQHEQISYERDGLIKVIKKAKGSVRDALNLLEQVRFESSSVTKASALRVFGYADDETLIALLDCIVNGDTEKLLNFLTTHAFRSLSAETLWESMVELLNASLWACYKIPSKNFADYGNEINRIVLQVPANYFVLCLGLLYDHELLFQKTGHPWYLFELLLVRMCQSSKNPSTIELTSVHKPIPYESTNNQSVTMHNRSRALVQKSAQVHQDNTNQAPSSGSDPWKLFVEQMNHKDPMIGSLFKQGLFEDYDQSQKKVTVVFAPEYHFFNDVIQTSEITWKEVLEKTFGVGTQLTVLLKKKDVNDAVPSKPVMVPEKEQYHHEQKITFSTVRELPVQKKTLETKKNSNGYKMIDVSDTQQWKKASLLKTVFQGTIREIVEESHE